jgi:5-methylcytosine-specific restriction endonuclease McrA
MAQMVLKKIDPSQKPLKVSAPKNSESRHIPVSIRTLIRQRDQGACTYVGPKSQRKCGSRFGIQIDHLIPYAHGGTHDPENLRLLCRAHNLHSAIQIFGATKMRAAQR